MLKDLLAEGCSGAECHKCEFDKHGDVMSTRFL